MKMMILTVTMIRPVNRTVSIGRWNSPSPSPPTAKGFFFFVLFQKLESPIINDTNDINRYTMRVRVY